MLNIVFPSSIFHFSLFYANNGSYPKLCCRYKESNGAGEDIFRRFSAYIKNPNPGLNDSKGAKLYISYWIESPFCSICRDTMEPVTPFCLSVLEKNFLHTLVKLDRYLLTPLPHELDQNPNITESTRRYLDGDTLTLADCNLLPKLNIVKVSRVQNTRCSFCSLWVRYSGSGVSLPIKQS